MLFHMIFLVRCCALLAWSGVMALAGCGASYTPAGGSGPTVPFSASALAGNWLITPTMPNLGRLTTTTPSLSMALTLDTTATQVSGIGDNAVSCSSVGFGGTWGFQKATFDSQGGFLLQQPSAPGLPANPYSLEVSGKAPAAAGESWSGTLTVTSSTTCPASGTLAFTATPIASATGTYQGNVTLYDSIRLPYAATMKGTLQQSGTNPVTGIFTNALLSGTAQFTGIPCLNTEMFATGTQLGSGLQGNLVLLNLTSADGGTTFSSGWIADTAAKTLDLDLVQISTPSCSSKYTINSSELTKQ